MHRQSRDLGPFITFVDRLAERASAARVAVLAEAVERGRAGRVGTARMRGCCSGRRGCARVARREWSKVVDASLETRYAGLRRALLEGAGSRGEREFQEE